MTSQFKEGILASRTSEYSATLRGRGESRSKLVPQSGTLNARHAMSDSIIPVTQMSLTTFQQIVLKAMEKMTISQQSAVARFAATLPKQRALDRVKPQNPVKQGARLDGVPAPNTKNLVNRNQLNGVQNQPKRSQSTTSPSKKPDLSTAKKDRPSGSQQSRVTPNGSKLVDRNFRDTEWLLSENRRRESAPRRSEPKGQKWATNRWNHSGS
jgi:hypothetical protein